MAGDDLDVDPKAVSDYAGKMSTFGMQASMKVPPVLAQMPATAQDAFANFTSAGVFAESALMLAAVERLNSDFSAFNADMGKGLMAIANAAELCAVSYANTDNESANSIGLVDFAFADPFADRPAGVGDKVGDTMADQEMAARSNLPQSVTDPEGGTTVNLPFGTFTNYPDGSSRSTVTSYEIDPATGQSYPITTTTYTGADGKVVNSTAQWTTTAASGATTAVRQEGARRVTTVTAPNGAKTITTTQKTDEGWKPIKGVDPITIAAPSPDDRPDTSQDGPLETAVEEFPTAADFSDREGQVDPGTAGDPWVPPNLRGVVPG